MPPKNFSGMLGVRNATLRNLCDSVPRLQLNFLPALLLGAWAGEEGSMRNKETWEAIEGVLRGWQEQAAKSEQTLLLLNAIWGDLRVIFEPEQVL